ncbi:sensor domain-containing protein [Ciceribacter thiooxidans]|uniref:EAL domain-containing protein n=1 Tax=Ciceribacter thiooxidans TaxID=1969821 RepID=A0ABV7I1U2_9HYPH|nr:EAL domain-containing protein [Ciceribacter thiooxidans]
MPSRTSRWRRRGHAPNKGAFLLGSGLVAGVIVVAGVLADQRYTQAHRSALDQHVRDGMQVIRFALQTEIASDFATVRHIASEAAVNSDRAQLRRAAAILGYGKDHIRSFEYKAGPAATAETLYSLANAPASTAASPSAVPQGGQMLRLGNDAFRLSVPVGRTGAKGRSLVSMTIDARGLLQASGLLQPDDGMPTAAPLPLADLQWSIRHIAPDAAPLDIGPRFATDAAPTIGRLNVPGGGAFEILAAPQGGWDTPPENRIAIRLAIVFAGAAIMIPAAVTGILFRDRNRYVAELKQREKKLRELSQRLNLAMDSADIGIWEVRLDGHVLLWDDRSAALHGRAPSFADDEDRISDWTASIHPDDRERVEAQAFAYSCIAVTDTTDLNYRVVLPDGSVRHLRSVGAHSLGEEGESRLTGVVLDVTADAAMTQTLRDAKQTSDIKNAELELALDELSSREQELSELSHKFDLALASYNCGIWEADPVSATALWDERMHQLYGIPYSPRRLDQQGWLSCLHPDYRERVLAATNKALETGTTINTLQQILLPNGEPRYVRSVGQVHVGRDGKEKIIGIAFDVTADALLAEELRAAKAEADARNIELELAKNRIEFNALHDPLTALANRRKLDDELDRLVRSGAGRGTRFAILHLDLDRFKEINDTLGHAAGDAVLTHTADILSRTVEAGDLVARIGGDEFVILITRPVTTEELSLLSERIIEEMRKPVDFDGFSCRCGVSIGIARSQGIGSDPRKVLINADIALYQAKEKGRNGYEFFSQALQANIVTRKRLADDILAGLERDEFTVWYQPQFDATTMRLTGAEALVRWNHPDQGILASGRFLRLAEELNVMARIDQLVLETALRDKMRWLADGIDLPRISVNVSSRRLHDPALPDQLRGLSIRPGEVAFELVESIFLDDSDDPASANLADIKALGIDIEIDDFGTGHTSIVSLLRLKPKRLKIDRQLVMPILTSPQERALVRSIVEIARSLGIETIAEGVETPAHAELLRTLGCDELQGYAFAKPLPFAEFARFAARRAGAPAARQA